MAVIRSTFTTMGVSDAASLSTVGWYRYNGDKPLEKPELPSPPKSQNVKAATARQKRLAEFGRLLTEEKLTWEQAAERLGICLSTARHYDRELKDQQRRERRDA
jgi:hypothetical protein